VASRKGENGIDRPLRYARTTPTEFMSVNSSELLNLRRPSGSSDATMTKEGRSRSYKRDVPLNDCCQIYGTLGDRCCFFQVLHRAMKYLRYEASRSQTNTHTKSLHVEKHFILFINKMCKDSTRINSRSCQAILHVAKCDYFTFTRFLSVREFLKVQKRKKNKS